MSHYLDIYGVHLMQDIFLHAKTLYCGKNPKSVLLEKRYASPQKIRLTRTSRQALGRDIFFA